MKYYPLFLAFLFPVSIYGQVTLVNPSFEGDEPQDAVVPAGWHPCKIGTTPDILPGVWGVTTEPSEGETFVGLITRLDGTWESIGQRLSEPLQLNECYTLTLDLAHSPTYAGYNNPIKLRVWAGQAKCGKNQLLAETDFVKHADWQTYSFRFAPKQPLNYIILEAFYTEGSDFSYKGNIMIDNLQAIKKCIRADASDGIHLPSSATGTF